MASLISPQIKKQYFDSNGDPLNGGKLYVYEAGTTTPVTSYVDEAESSANANPIILNSRGEVGGLFLRADSYKFVLTDSDDATIWTVDNVTVRDVGTELDTLSATVSTINTSITAEIEVGRIVSGKASSNSSRARFLVPIGSSNQVKVLATATNLVYIVNGTSYTLDADLVVSGLTSPPTTNNTALVNDSTLAGGNETKNLGEMGSVIPYDTAGSEITTLDGQVAAFKIGAEYFIGRIDNTNSCLRDCRRGYFYDNTGAAIERVTFSDNATITLQKLSWLYLTTAGTMLVSYTEPFHGTTQPSSPNNGDFWKDASTGIWMRFNSTVWVDSEAIPVGLCVQDENSNTVAARPDDFYADFKNTNTYEIERVDNTLIRSKNRNDNISVYGNKVLVTEYSRTWNIANDLEDGETEAASTYYYAYVKENADSVLSPHAPYDNRGELNGIYHPYEAWRYVGRIFNDSSLHFDGSTIEQSPEFIPKIKKQTAISSAASIQLNEEVILLDSSSAAMTMGLPPASIMPGKVFILKKTSSDFNKITIDAYGSETINGATTTTLMTQYEGIKIFSDGSNWIILERTGIVTKWTDDYSADFTFTAYGTVSAQSIWTRRNGDCLEIMGNVTAGTTTSGTWSMNTPAKFTFDYGKMRGSGSDTKVGTCTVGPGGNFGAGHFHQLFVDGSEDNKFYKALSGSLTTLTKMAGNATTSNSGNYILATVPIVDWKGADE